LTEVEVRLTEAPPGFAQGIESVPFLMAFTIIYDRAMFDDIRSAAGYAPAADEPKL
jgi:hypothetical protein